MVTVSKTEREAYPAVKLIGKRYTDADRGPEGSFSAKWDQWFASGWFQALQSRGGIEKISDDFVGAMRCTDQGFEYWIGVLMAPGDPVPEDFGSVDLPAGDLAVSYLRGKQGSGELYGMEAYRLTMKAWAEKGWKPKKTAWFLERYNCPRFTTPDENGDVILDYCAYLD